MITNALLVFCVSFLITGCMTAPQPGGGHSGATAADTIGQSSRHTLEPEIEERVLALDPENVTSEQIRDVLSKTPAPRIINIHGGILPVQGYLISFSQFLTGMGYPEVSIRNPRDGTYTFGYYDSSEMIAGVIAWYYEHEGLRPMLVGHSQGGFLALRVLYHLVGYPLKDLKVWNPLTGEQEARNVIVDPLTGKQRPVVGLQVSYATATVAGGLARLLPNQWSIDGKLRKIPDSVEEFTGFQKPLDLLGGDFLGYGPANDYKPTGTAVVRNIRLPATYAHTTIPNTRHLALNQATRDWIDDYRPKPAEPPALNVKFEGNSSHILWAADVWYSVKKHWVLELQRLIRAERSRDHGTA